MIRTYLFLFLLAGTSLSYAQKINNKKLDAYFDTLARHEKFMGSVAVSKNGQPIYQKTIGLADVQQKKTATNSTIYRTGSISKSFTATLVMKAVEEKKIRLEQSIKKFFPKLLNAEKISVSQLLAHQSGIADFTESADYKSWNTLAKTEGEMTDAIAKGGSDFEPGTKTIYSNSNYVLLTYLLEHIYQKPFKSLLMEKITTPIGLKQTYIGSKIDPTRNEARSYNFDQGWQAAEETDMSIPLGSGAIVSTPSDLVKFAEALFNGKIISKTSLALMLPQNGMVGYGLFLIPFDDQISYGHRGGIDRFTAVFSYFPKEGIAFALTSNGTDYNNNEIPITVLKAAFGQDFEIPTFNSYVIQPEHLRQYHGIYTSTQLPFKITISSNGKNLVAQADGQAAMTFEANAKDTFRFTKAGIALIFEPEKNIMQLKQGGSTFSFARK